MHAAYLSYLEAFLDEAPCMQAQTVSGGHQASPQMLAALRMLRAVFGSPGNPFVGDRAVVEFFAQYHFLHFARLSTICLMAGTPWYCARHTCRSVLICPMKGAVRMSAAYS